MIIDLPNGVEDELRRLAEKQGQDARTLAEEAIRQYLIAAAITDIDADDVAETQTAIIRELPKLVEWKASDP